jgi:copper homeostasis protein (lipoprotein)
MKTKLLFSVFIISILFACQQKNTDKNVSEQDSLNTQVIDHHNARTSLDYVGVYRGILPCADCPGIETIIYLNENDTYTLSTKYLERGVKVFENKGNYTWNKEGNTITLSNITSGPNMYFVGENTLTQLDMDGNRITGEIQDAFVLTKQMENLIDADKVYQDTEKVNLNDRLEAKTVIKTGNPAVGKFTLAETKWKLVELNGKPVKQVGKKPYILKLNSKDGRFSAFAGCNNMMGSYVMKTSYSLTFSGVASTMMACPNMDLEQKFGTMLEKVDNYVIVEDKLQLNKAKMAPLARFVAVN